MLEGMLCITFFALLLMAACLAMVAKANANMKELALEALLASKANSAEDMAQATIAVHQAAADRQQPVNTEAFTGPVSPTPEGTFQGPNGTILSFLQPR